VTSAGTCARRVALKVDALRIEERRSILWFMGSPWVE
jgi:hypothetical protein